MYDIARQVRGCRGIQYRAARLGCTCGTAIYDLQSAYIFCFIIRKLRYFFDFLSGFTSGEYRIALVDFIYSSRGRLERDRGFANPLSLSNTSPDPWGYPLRRGISAAAGLGQYRIPVSGADCSSPVPNLVWMLCVRAMIVRVSVGLPSWYRSFFIIGGMDCSCLRLRGVLLWLFVGFARNLWRRLTREWVVSFGG